MHYLDLNVTLVYGFNLEGDHPSGKGVVNDSDRSKGCYMGSVDCSVNHKGTDAACDTGKWGNIRLAFWRT